jgi:hypothetical protein
MIESKQKEGKNFAYWIKDEIGNIRILKYSNIGQEKNALSREIMHKEEEVWRFFSEFWSQNNTKWSKEIQKATNKENDLLYLDYLQRNRAEFREFHREWLSRLWKLGKLYLRRGPFA